MLHTIFYLSMGPLGFCIRAIRQLETIMRSNRSLTSKCSRPGETHVFCLGSVFESEIVRHNLSQMPDCHLSSTLFLHASEALCSVYDLYTLVRHP